MMKENSENHHPIQPFQVFPILDVGVVVNGANEATIRRTPAQNVVGPLSPSLLEPCDNDLESNSLDVDSFLSKKLNKLTMEERTQGIYELHGVADSSIIETPEMLQEKLRELTRCAHCSFSSTDTEAYRKAMDMDDKYVERMKLLCLRADYYDSKKAASRLMSFFTYKLSLFGPDKLARDITLEDIEGDCKQGLYDGIFQLLQERDRAGRAIIMFAGKHAANYTLETFLRAFYYVTMQAIRDEDIQKKGLVLVNYLIGQEKFHSDRPAKLGRSFLYLPIRMVAIHLCCDNTLMDLAVKIMSHAVESHHLCRVRGHHGSFLDNVYTLMTFGIPKHVLPINMENGEIDLSAHHGWLGMVRAREERQRQQLQLQQTTSSLQGEDIPRAVTPISEIAVPGPMDIIVGRGSNSRSSTGYLRMRNIVENYQDKYENAGRAEKTNIAKIILQEALNSGCRFVRWTPEGLVECNEVEARDKISHTFRNMRRRTNTGESKGTTMKRAFQTIELS